MHIKKIMRLSGMLALCLACLWASTGNVRATDQKEMAKKKFSCDAALRKHFKNWGIYLGKSNQCYYTYAENIYGNRKNGIVIVGFQETMKEIKIPEKIKGKKVIAIHLVIPDAISGDFHTEALSMKERSKTKSILIPRYVNEISNDSFEQDYYLSNLNKVRVSPKNKHFYSKSGVLFTKDGKTLLIYPDMRKASKYQVPKGVTSVSGKSFQNAYIGHVMMPNTIKTIAPYAFSNAHLNKVSFPKNLKSIGTGAFEYCNFQKIILPKRLETLGTGAFEGCKFREVIIPGNVKTIPDYCFYKCNELKKVTIKKGVAKIKERAFACCYQLKKIIIPSSVKKMEEILPIDSIWHSEMYDDIDIKKLDQEAWRNAKVTFYVEKGSYAYRKLGKVRWAKELGIKIKTM